MGVRSYSWWPSSIFFLFSIESVSVFRLWIVSLSFEDVFINCLVSKDLYRPDVLFPNGQTLILLYLKAGFHSVSQAALVISVQYKLASKYGSPPASGSNNRNTAVINVLLLVEACQILCPNFLQTFRISSRERNYNELFQ